MCFFQHVFMNRKEVHERNPQDFILDEEKGSCSNSDAGIAPLQWLCVVSESSPEGSVRFEDDAFPSMERESKFPSVSSIDLSVGLVEADAFPLS